MKKLLPLLITSFLAWLPTTDAQLTISGEDVVVCENGTVSVDISVSNFIDIVSAQFAITWDTAVVSYTGVTNNMPASVLYNTTNAGNGEIHFSWFDAGPPPFGFTFPPSGSGVIFTVNFNIVGNYNPDDFTAINITSIPTCVLEIASTSGVIPNNMMVIEAGSVTIDDLIPPVVTCPSNIIVTAGIGQNNAVVNYAAPTVTDNCDVPPPAPTSSPASGSTFPVGITTVNASATDTNGNTSNCSFTVTVNPPPPNPNALLVTADDFALECNETAVDIPIRVENFEDMVSSQFAILWDSTVLEYLDSTDLLNSTGHPTALYNVNNASKGEIRFSWIDSNGSPGEDLPDSTVIFILHFNLLDASALPTNVIIGSLPGFDVEFANIGGIIVPPNYALENSIVSINPDTLDPSIICPASVAVFADSNCEATGLALGTPTTSDNCGVNPATNNAPATFLLGTTIVTWTVTDSSGNSATCQQTVTVTDNTPPTISCPPAVAVFADGNCEATNVSLGTPNTADNCGVDTVTDNAPAVYSLGANIVTWTVTDLNGNSNTCQQTVTVTDNTPPTITCPADISVGTDAGSCEATNVSLGTPVASDNCSLNPATNDAPSALQIGATTVTWTVTDMSGNSATCQQTVTVTDDDAPSIICPTSQLLAASANCDAILLDYTAFAIVSDNCTDTASIVVTQFPLPGTVITDTTEVRLIATDGANLSDTCYFDVIVEDITAPNIACPANDTLDVDAGECFGTLVLPAATASDNCGVATVTDDGPANDQFPAGTTTVIFTATDLSGNTSTCQVSVTVIDNEAPSIVCPATQPLAVDANCEGILDDYTALATVSDNCTDTASIVVTQFPLPGTVITDTTEVRLIATDGVNLSDTCYFDVILIDNTAPSITCPANDTLDVDAGECFATLVLAAATATDNCGLDTLFDNGPANDQFPAGTNTVTFTAIDLSGNTSTCQVVVVVNDTIVPVITCPANILAQTDPDNCTAVVTWANPVIVDNCASSSTVTYTPPSGTEFPIGDSTVVCIVEDPSGNRDTCEFLVTVTDGQAPSLSCVADTTILVPAGTLDTIINDIYLFSIGDNCGIDTSYFQFSGAIPSGGGTGSDASGTAFPVGTTTVTYFGEDDEGNVGSCAFDVTIEEDVLLTLTCPPDQSVGNAPGNCGALVNGLIAVASPPSQVQSSFYQISGATIGNGAGLNASGGYNVGTSTVTFTVVTTTNQTVTCAVNVVVADTTAPVIVNCPVGNDTLANTLDSCGLVFSGSVLPTASDNCPGVTITYSIPVGSLLPLGNHNIVATASDLAGNTATCSYQLTVVDDQLPEINNCVNGTTISLSNAPGQCGATAVWPAVTADDNCGIFAFVLPPLGSGSFFPVGTTAVTYTAIDLSGNSSNCSFNVVVIDNEPPALVCPGNLPAINTDLNQCSAVVNFPAPTATDNCGPVTPIAITPSGPVFDEGVHTVTYNATDAAGNLTSCSFTVTVVDNTPPFIPNMPADMTVDTDAGECGATVVWTLPNFPLDNCGIESFGSNGGTPGDFFGVGTHDIDYVALDINGNVAVETFTITVEDNESPVVDCPSSVIISVDGSILDDPDGLITTFQQVDCDNIELTLAELIPTDACGLSSFIQTEGLSSGSDFPVGTTTMVFVVTDNNGNQTTCSYDIEVLAPQIAPATVSQSQVCEGGTVTFTVGGMPGATYLWTNGMGQTVSNQQTFTLTNVALNQAGIYTAYVSMAFCDLQFTAELSVNPAPVVTIDANDILCVSNALPLNLTAVNSSTAIVNNWTWTYPNGAIVQGQNQTIPNPTIANSGFYTVVATSTFGCTASASEFISIATAPPTPTLFGTTSNTCVGSSVVMNGQPYSGSNVTYNWFATPAAGSGLTSINNFIVNVQPTAPGTYIYSFFVEVDGCTSDTAEWVVNVEAYPSIDLDVIGETLCVDGGTNVTLIDNGTGAISWDWNGPFGDLPGNTSSVVLQNVNPSFSGVYTVVASTANGCSSTASTTLTFTSAPSPDAQLTASDAAICEGGVVTLTGTLYAGATYFWSGDGLPSNTQNLSEVVAAPIGTGVFEYSYVAVVGGCSTDTVSVEVVVEPMPTVDITVTGAQSCVDGTSPITLSTNATGIANYVWTDINGNILSNAATLTLDSVTAANSGFYFLDVVASGSGCLGFGSVSLDITDGLDGLTAILTGVGCEDDELNFEASAIVGATYQWFTPANALFSTLQNPTIMNAQSTGSGIYTVVASLNGCTDMATVDVELLGDIDAVNGEVVGFVNVPQEFDMSAFVNFDFENYTVNILQQPLNGTVTLVNDSIYVFTPNADFWGTDNLIVEFCNANCPAVCDVAKVTLIVNYPPDQCVITTVISPNDDGANDEFVVSCAEANLENTLVIFNQWGDKVYEAAPYANDWKGTHDGKDLPDGTYFFIFQRTPSESAQKGFVMIYR